jgi:uroporphyrinogen decarboxylase
MNKIERVQAVFRDEKPDCTPAGFWYHYKRDYTTAEMIAAHLTVYRETGADIMKVMQDYGQEINAEVKVPGDWKGVKFPGAGSPVYQKLADVLKGILDAIGGETLIFQTIFSPFKTAVNTYGDALVMAHAKEAPDQVAAAMRGIAESLTEWAAGFVELGAAGLFYAAQFSEPGRFTKEEWEALVKPGDLAVMKGAADKGGRNILHICGEPEYQFRTQPEWFTDYPAAIVNWSVKDTGLSLKEGKALFRKPVLGGMNNKGNILKGSDDEIRSEVEQTLSGIGAEGFMLGADCTIQGQGISHQKMKTAVDAAHGRRL